MPGIGSEDSGSRECFLRTLQENNDSFREFKEDSRHKQDDNDEEETQTQSA